MEIIASMPNFLCTERTHYAPSPPTVSASPIDAITDFGRQNPAPSNLCAGFFDPGLQTVYQVLLAE